MNYRRPTLTEVAMRIGSSGCEASYYCPDDNPSGGGSPGPSDNGGPSSSPGGPPACVIAGTIRINGTSC
jgi:hypothetical protein